MACRNVIHFLLSEVLQFSQEIEDLSLDIENLERETIQKTNVSSGNITIETTIIYRENTQSQPNSLISPHIDALPVRTHSKARSSEHDSPGNRCCINKPFYTTTPKRHVQFIEPDHSETVHVPETPSFTRNTQQIKTRADETNVNHCWEYILKTPCYHYSFATSSSLNVRI